MKEQQSLVIAIDFDGTCTSHDFPRIGKEIGAPMVLRDLVRSGHKLVLFTMRSDIENVEIPEGSGLHATPGNYLADAVNWFKDHNIPLYGIQKNPTQESWTHSPKCYANLYIDDAALGCPLIYPKDGRPHVDWEKVRFELTRQGIIEPLF
jgi:hypothetical protein